MKIGCRWILLSYCNLIICKQWPWVRRHRRRVAGNAQVYTKDVELIWHAWVKSSMPNRNLFSPPLLSHPLRCICPMQRDIGSFWRQEPPLFTYFLLLPHIFVNGFLNPNRRGASKLIKFSFASSSASPFSSVIFSPPSPPQKAYRIWQCQVMMVRWAPL